MSAGHDPAGPASASTATAAPILPNEVKSSPTPAPEARTEWLPGPLPAEVVRVVDGDTLLVRAHIWIGQEVEVAVRIRGIDAPELRAGCAGEHALAVSAADFVREAVSGRTVRLSAVSGGKYFGRVLADVTTADGRAPMTAGRGRAGVPARQD
ncbi:MAG TPA: thermonuclease family protein [Hyphomicrobiales bacterium]|nr:thermonuclease family protein [Hyphomicrobiales bacterium]